MNHSNLGTKYLAFGGVNYYPSGGWDDFIGAYDDLDVLKKILTTALQEGRADWVQIVDTKALGIIYHGYGGQWYEEDVSE